MAVVTVHFALVVVEIAFETAVVFYVVAVEEPLLSLVKHPQMKQKKNVHSVRMTISTTLFFHQHYFYLEYHCHLPFSLVMHPWVIPILNLAIYVHCDYYCHSYCHRRCCCRCRWC